MARPPSPEYDLYKRGVLIRLAGLDAGYGAATVLLGVDFEARAGEVSIITGPSAAGKTTLTHVMRLALPPRAGRAFILGRDVGQSGPKIAATVKRRIGYVAENPVFVEQWTAFDNVAMPLRMAGVKPRDYARDVRELVEFVGVAEAAELQMHKLSGAERRRIAIARALAAKPELILADDPTAGMSPSDGRRVVRLLSEMRRVGAGVVIATQDETLADCAPMHRWRIERGELSLVASAPADAEALK